MGAAAPRPPRLRTGGLTPLLRLVGLIALAILIVVLLVVWAQGCASDHQRGAYKSYMSDMGSVGSDSAQIGASLAELLTSAGLKQSDLLAQLGGLIQRQQQDVARAEKLRPPGPVRAENEHAIEALQLRVAGMQGLAKAFVATAKSKDAVQAGNLLAAQATRLTASDVVWSDLFQSPAQLELRQSRRHRRRGAAVRVRHQSGALHREVAHAGLDARARGVDGRHAVGPPRYEHRVRHGSAGQHAAQHDDRDDGAHLDGARVRGRGDERRRAARRFRSR